MKYSELVALIEEKINENNAGIEVLYKNQIRTNDTFWSQIGEIKDSIELIDQTLEELTQKEDRIDRNECSGDEQTIILNIIKDNLKLMNDQLYRICGKLSM